ncbi:MAG: 5'-methylthioadenosine/S-adenosylhomocysteine nucleosidase [Winkia neuii]|uniref:5'-methylthioadenosine/S-adenosylhomocysteine nucleosidase n=1 Tax=Winkia neuii TaxID=33007 RepID=UPI00079A614C|nr:5'-methylthioadenosine/S-adenosylhomocysteine nucleosidase [Winkia neuii]KWZ75052.1 MTA/SAH nucleosidase [Winkia neuii]MDK8100039.1 5'-methylthioadenosine/S-adenosylhomocysteine nucleosidase [Winkia neuii]MDU3135342.1 5'-methylthioadenosine/S-adenosylhomocysteine nucleosidase [Winkia neuii]
MSILIQVAMDLEAEPFLRARPAKETVRCGRAVCHLLEGPGQVLLATSAIGLVNAASCLTWVLDSAASALGAQAPTTAIAAGTCGGLGKNIQVRDVVAGRAYRYADADATAFGYKVGQLPSEPEFFEGEPNLLRRLEGREGVHVGEVVSGNSFVAAEQTPHMREIFPDALAADMESTALAQVAAARGISFVSVRGVSDLCGPQAGQDFHIDAAEAAEISATTVLGLLQS